MGNTWWAESNRLNKSGSGPDTNANGNGGKARLSGQEPRKVGTEESLTIILRNSTGGKRTGLRLHPDVALWMMVFPLDWLDLDETPIGRKNSKRAVTP